MHTLNVFAAGLALSVASANAISNQGKACSQAMKGMPFAPIQTFCSSFLNIQTSTIRTTATSTQKLITTSSTSVFTTPTETATSSPSTTLTVLETNTPRTRVTTTPTTTSTSTLSVTQEDTVTETAPAVTVTSSANMARVKRGLDMGPIFKQFAGPVVSEACSAIVANPSPKTTTTIKATQTVYTSTSTIVSTITAEPTTVTSTLEVATETTTQTEQASLVTDTDTAAEETVYETITYSTTTTSTATVTPTVTVAPPCLQGQTYNPSTNACTCPSGTVLDTSDQTCQVCTESNTSLCPVPSIGKSVCVNRQCSVGMTTYPPGPAFANCPASPQGYAFIGAGVRTPFTQDNSLSCSYRITGQSYNRYSYYRASDGRLTNNPYTNDFQAPAQAGLATSNGRACYLVCPPAIANAVVSQNSAYLDVERGPVYSSLSCQYSSGNQYAFACTFDIATGAKTYGDSRCPAQVQRSSSCIP